MVQEIRIAIISVWLIVSAILLLVLLSFIILPDRILMPLGAACQLQHSNLEPCPLCGMTRAFIAVSHGRFHQAITLNSWSLVLYSTILVNELLAAIFLLFRNQYFSLAYRIARILRKKLTLLEVISCKYLV